MYKIQFPYSQIFTIESRVYDILENLKNPLKLKVEKSKSIQNTHSSIKTFSHFRLLTFNIDHSIDQCKRLTH